MVQRIKEYTTVTDVPVDISCWISDALLDIMTTLTIDRDYNGIQSRDKLYPALSALKDTMAFLWGFLQVQRLPSPITWSIQKIIGVLIGHFNNLSSRLIRDRLVHGSSRPDYGKTLYFQLWHLANSL